MPIFIVQYSDNVIRLKIQNQIYFCRQSDANSLKKGHLMFPLLEIFPY